MKLVTKEQFDAALEKVLGRHATDNVPNRIQRNNMAIHVIFVDELEKGELSTEVEVIRTGTRALQEFGHYKWAEVPSPAEEG